MRPITKLPCGCSYDKRTGTPFYTCQDHDSGRKGQETSERDSVLQVGTSDGLSLPDYYYRCPECKHEWQENKDLSECPRCLEETLQSIKEQKARGVERPPRRPILFDGQRELKYDSRYMRRQA